MEAWDAKRICSAVSGFFLGRFPVMVTAGIYTVATCLAVAVVAAGLQQRSVLPGVPIWDPDTWGYLRPALGVLDGEPFRQVDGRGGFYPALLIGFLSWGGGFEGILRWQQALGAFSAVLLWGIWVLWATMLPASRARDLLAPTAGLGLLGLYYLNPNTMLFEAGLRPEAVIFAFGFAQLFCVMGFLVLAGREGGRLWLGVSGSLAVFLAHCCFCLKPSWVLASAFTSLPVVFGVLRSGKSRAPALAALAVGALAVTGLFAALKVTMERDHFGRTFLANTLFTIHAQFIHAAFLAGHPEGDSEKIQAMLPVFTAELGYARTHAGTYKILGLDADYLMYRSRFREPLARFGMDDAAYSGFLYRAYLAAWRHDPDGMALKIARQMGMFFFPAPGTFLSNKTELRREWGPGLEIARSRAGEVGGRAGGLLGESLRAADESTGLQVVLRSPAWVRPLRVWLAVATPLLVPLFFLALAACAKAGGPYLKPGIAAAVFFSAAFGNAFTVSVIHALDIERYCQTFGPFLALSLVAMAVWLALAGMDRYLEANFFK